MDSPIANSGANMTSFPMNYKSEVTDVARLEEQLVQTLKQTAHEVDHMECFDDEQRSEIYTILRTMQDDTVAHRRLVGQWVSDRPEGN